MLFLSGETQAIGRVDNGDTVMDFMPQERERGITISAAAISFYWKQHKVNLIDTPGHVDFTIEVERSTRVLDGSVIIIDAVSGVQAQTQTVWKQVCKQNIPSIAFINKMDRDGANFYRSLESIHKKLGANAIPIQIPICIGNEDNFIGVVDLISMRKFIWSSSSSSPSSSRIALPPIITTLSLKGKDDDNDDDDESYNELYHQALKQRHVLFEALADADEIFMELYLQSNETDYSPDSVSSSGNYNDGDGDDDTDHSNIKKITTKDILSALRRCCLTNTIVPTLCGASLRCKGIEPLLDSILTFLPNPLEIKPLQAIHTNESSSSSSMKSSSMKSSSSVSSSSVAAAAVALKSIHPISDKDLCALAFKVTHDALRGPLVYVRVFSGSISSKQTLYNSTKGVRERINQILEVSADDLEMISECNTGEVCCILGLKHTVTGDTLVGEHSSLKKYRLHGLDIPPSVYSLSIEPERDSLQKELDIALNILCMEDPSLRVEINKESGQTLLHGLGKMMLL